MYKIVRCSLLFVFSVVVAQEGIQVRPATSNELSAILALDREISFEYFKPIFLQYPDRSIGKSPDEVLNDELAYDTLSFAEAVNSKNNKYLYVASAGESIIGFVHFHRNQESIVIDLACVEKKYRGHGVGQRLVNEIFNVPNIDAYRLAVIKKNNQAIQFWQSLDFTLLEKKPDDVGNDFPEDCADIYDYYEYRNLTKN